MSKKIQIPNPIKVVETGTPTTENLVKGQVAIKEEDGKLVIFGNAGGEKIQSTAPQKYDYQKLISLTEESSDADIRAALTPIGGTEVVWPNIGDEVVRSLSGTEIKGIFLGGTPQYAKGELHFIFNLDLFVIRINISDEYSISLQLRLPTSTYSEFKDIVTALNNTVTQQGTQIQQVQQKADKPLHDLFVSLGATYNGDGTYTMNELTDLTYEDLTNSYKAYVDGWNRFDLTSAYEGERIRTNFIAKGHLGSWIPVSIHAMLSGAYNIETFSFKDSIYITSIYSAFKSARKLKKVIGQIILGTRFTGSTTENDFYQCKELESIQLKSIMRNLWFQDSPKLTKESILYMIQNSAATSAITITLHPTAYVMAIADSDIQAALEEKTFVSLSQGTPTITE